MRRAVASLFTLALLAGCAPKDEPAPEAAAPAAVAAPTLADFAGTWSVTSTLSGVATPVPSTLSGTGDSGSWTMSLEGRPNIPLTVSIVGDSLIAVSAEYESILQKGVMVTTRTASVVKDGAMSGNLTATYKKATGDEVVTGTIVGTKNP